MMVLKAIAAGVAGSAILTFLTFVGIEMLVRPTKAGLSMLFGLGPAAILSGFLIGVSLVVGGDSKAPLWIAAGCFYGLGGMLGAFDAAKFWNQPKAYRMEFELELPADFDGKAHRWRWAGADRQKDDYTFFGVDEGKSPRVLANYREMYIVHDSHDVVVYRPESPKEYVFRGPEVPAGSPAAPAPWTEWRSYEDGFRFRWRIR